MCDGATAPVGRNPVAIERRYWTHKLLVEQAKRAAADGWADTDPAAAQPYALLAANRYLDGAVTVLFEGEPSENDPRRKAIESERSKLAVPRFELSIPVRLDITDRPVESLPYTIKPTGASTGYPVVRVRNVSLPLKAKETQNTYRVVPEFVEASTAIARRDLGFTVATTETGSTGKFDLDLLFRGHLLTKPVEARVASRTLEWVFHPPTGQKASFAIKGDEALKSGAVAVLFDATKSMNTENQNGKTRYQEAATGLRDVIAKLPPGTYLSVSRFGSAAGGILEAPLRNLKRLSDQPEQDAKEVAKSVLDKIADGNDTPLSEAIGLALKADGLFPGKDFTGFRTLIVLTDGADNVTGDLNKPTARPGEKILEALQKCPQDVGLHLVLFGIDPIEYDVARIQLDVIEDIKGFKVNRTPAQIWPKKKGGKEDRLVRALDVVNVLKDEMQPRISIRRSSAGDSPSRLPVSVAADKRWQWMLPLQEEGVFSLSAFGGIEQQVQLAPGDRLMLEMKRGRQGAMEFSLPSYADAMPDPAVTARTTSMDRSVVLTVPRNSLTPRGGTYDLDLTATLEKPLAPGDRLVRDTPLFAWFDVTPQNGNGLPPSLKVENLLRRLAPAWRITGPWVPKAGEAALNRLNGAAPRVDAYWLEREPTAKFTKEITSLKAIDLEFLEKDKKFSVDGTDVEVDIAPPTDGLLTIRVRHADKRPVLVRVKVQGVKQRWTLGEEHRYYGQANCYTAVFGPFESEDYNRRVTLEFFTIDSLRALAQHMTLDLPRGPVADSPDLLEEVKLSKD